MSVTAKPIINAQAAPVADTTLYTVPSGLRTIIDKFTATNTDAAAQTISINLIPAGSAVGATNLIVKTLSIAAGVTYSFSIEMSNQILAQGDTISIKASSANIIIRASGRELA